MDLAAAVERYQEEESRAKGGLATFLDYCEVDDTSELRAAQVVDFLHYLVAAGYAPGTVRMYRTDVNCFFRWLYHGKLVSSGADALEQAFAEQAGVVPVLHLGTLKGPEERDVRGLIEAAYDAAPHIGPDTAMGRRRYLYYLRNIAIVEMLRATGLRATELAALRRRDLDEENQVAYAPDGRVVHFDLESWGAVARYLEARARYLEARGDPVCSPLLVRQTPVFARHSRGSTGRGLLPLSARSVRRIVQGLRTTETLTATQLRIRFGQRVLEATADEHGTAALLGLKQVRTVRRYAKR